MQINKKEISNNILSKLPELSPEELNSVLQFIKLLQDQQSSIQPKPNIIKQSPNPEEKKAFAKELQTLFKELQSMPSSQTITEEEIATEVEACRRDE